jgi:hydrogenase-4 component E
MSAATAGSVIDVLAIGMVVLAIGVVWTRSLGQALLLFAQQSLLLAAAALSAALATSSSHIFIGAALTLSVKAVIAPALLWKVLLNLPTSHDVQASIGQRTGVLLAILIAFVFAQALDTQPFHTSIGSERVLPTAVSVMAIGILVMVTHRQALTQVVGFLIIENSMALAALTATFGMPLVVELGIFLDLLAVVFVAFMYTGRMHVLFGTGDTHEHMRTLKW